MAHASELNPVMKREVVEASGIFRLQVVQHRPVSDQVGGREVYWSRKLEIVEAIHDQPRANLISQSISQQQKLLDGRGGTERKIRGAPVRLQIHAAIECRFVETRANQ